MAAEAAISSAVNILGRLLIEKASFLLHVKDEVVWLKDELKTMRSFLRDAAQKQGSDERIRDWVSKIREVAQDAEDAIETFILKVETPTNSMGPLGKCACFPVHVSHLDKVGNEIMSIKARLQQIETSRQRYGIQNLGEGMDSSSSRSDEGVKRRRQLAYWKQDNDVVGLEEDVQKLLQESIFIERERLSIATIVGMGGIGKSTLAKKLYNHAVVIDRFDCRAWVVVSSEFGPRQIMKELVLQLLNPGEDKLNLLQTMEKLDEQSLQEMVYKRLEEKKYLIVVDDVWEDAHWEFMENAFPDQGKSSRLLVTSRNRVITKYALYAHDMKLLDSKQSWELLLKKAFIHENTESKFPEELEGIGRQILKKCDGLPLAIAVVGGLLVDKAPSKNKWENILKEIDSHLGKSGSTVSTILEISYLNLTPQLKSCFLYLGFFKEDAAIRVRKLVQVWIAQGLVSQATGEETMEEIGRHYLDELINRNMVQIKDMSGDQVKSCRIHDLIRELSLTKAKEEISFEILKEDGNSQLLDKPRHSVVCSSESFIRSAGKTKHLRSLFFHGVGRVTGHVDPSYWESLDLLKVLDFEDFGLNKLSGRIGALTGLRYLGLRGTRIGMLPCSLGRLKNLDVLDLQGSYVEWMPPFIWKIESLRHIYMSRWSSKICKELLKANNLKNLQTLTKITLDKTCIVHLTKIAPNLRKLSFLWAGDSHFHEAYNSLVMLKNLECLIMNSLRSMDNLHGLGDMHRITRLKIYIPLEGPLYPTYFPPNLSYLTLKYNHLSQDPTLVLEKLPNLLHLKLIKTHRDKEMVISHDGFPSLKILTLHYLANLEKIRVREGGMPELKQLDIYNCPLLNINNLPEELKSKATIVNRSSYLNELINPNMIQVKDMRKDESVKSYSIHNLRELSIRKAEELSFEILMENIYNSLDKSRYRAIYSCST